MTGQVKREWQRTSDGYRVFEFHDNLAHEIVCWTAGNSKQRTQQARDNARLIAAAPDLLETTKMALDIFTTLRKHPRWPWKKQESESKFPVEVFLRAAIAKATGEA